MFLLQKMCSKNADRVCITWRIITCKRLQLLTTLHYSRVRAVSDAEYLIELNKDASINVTKNLRKI